MTVISAACNAGLAGLVVATVLGIHTGAALAQQPVADPTANPAPAQAPEPQPVPQQYPPGYAPPPGYGPPQGYPPPQGYAPPPGYGPPPPAYSAPPPRYSYYPPPPPPPPRSSTDRVFMIGGSLGLGGMSFHDNDDVVTSGAAFGYSGRLGFGVGPRLLLLIGVDGAVVADNNFVYDQQIYYIGLQAFLTRQLFIRGGAGIGNITGKDNYGDFLYFGKTGLGLTGSVGVELLQGYNWSLELAGQLTSGFYSGEKWTSGTGLIGFNFF